MRPEFKLSIVIPCYNEEKKLDITEYTKFIKNNNDTFLYFVNDGSTDSSINIIKELKALYPLNVNFRNLEKNVGKAESVRIGMNDCLKDYPCDYFAYLDADLAVSLDECKSITNYISDDVEFCFGSRIKILGSRIDRKTSRFIIGRFIATIISLLLSIDVYDTQCGCKVFKRQLITNIFQSSFISRWLFDVEIFFRLIKHYGKENIDFRLREIPLNSWIEKGDSKVRITYSLKMWVDLLKIYKKYK